MGSFDTDQSVDKNEPQTDQFTFKVGDREFDADSAAKKITNQDSHILTIEEENQAYRDKIASLEAKLEQSTTLESALQKLQQPAKPESLQQEQKPVDSEKLGEVAREAALSVLQEHEQQQQLSALEAAKEKTFEETKAQLAGVLGTEDLGTKIVEATGLSLEKAVGMASDPDLAKLLVEKVTGGKAPSQSFSGDKNPSSLQEQKPENPFAGKHNVTTQDIIKQLNA